MAIVLLASAFAGCETSPAPARAPTSPVVQAPATIPPADLPELGARFFNAGLTRFFETDDAGRITRIQTRTSKGGSLADGVSFAEHALTWARTYGDALGYGRLGEPQPEGEARTPTRGMARVILTFPRAEGCAGLVVSLGYSDGTVRAPYYEDILCPSAPGSAERLARLREAPTPAPDVPATTPAAPPTPAVKAEEPLALWLRAQGYVTSSVARTAGTLVITLAPKPADPAVARRAFAARFAKDVARTAGLPALDHTAETDFHARTPTHRLRIFSQRLGAPPLDGACIDPSVSITLDEPFDAPTTGYWPSSVSVTCEHEPTGGPQPPVDTARTLPRTARRPLPFLAACTSANFAWGTHRGGWVIDRKGDVYTFRGGRTSSARTARELALLLRHEKTYVGTLPPDDADRLADLAAKVEREPLVRTTISAADRGGGGCSAYKGGGSGELAPVELDSFGSDHDAARTGPASAELAKVMGRAKTLVQRGK